MDAVTLARQPGRVRRKRRPRAGRRGAWLLTAPALVVMVAVAGCPVLYGVWLSLQRYDLRFPDERGFVGLGNYAAVLSAPVFGPPWPPPRSSPSSRSAWSWPPGSASR